MLPGLLHRLQHASHRKRGIDAHLALQLPEAALLRLLRLLRLLLDRGARAAPGKLLGELQLLLLKLLFLSSLLVLCGGHEPKLQPG